MKYTSNYLSRINDELTTVMRTNIRWTTLLAGNGITISTATPPVISTTYTSWTGITINTSVNPPIISATSSVNYWTVTGTNDIYLNQAGNLVVGTQTNLTNKVQVQGTTSISGLLTANGGITTGTSSLITANNGITVNTGSLTCVNNTFSKTYTATSATTGTSDILTMRYDTRNGIRFQQGYTVGCWWCPQWFINTEGQILIINYTFMTRLILPRV